MFLIYFFKPRVIDRSAVICSNSVTNVSALAQKTAAPFHGSYVVSSSVEQLSSHLWSDRGSAGTENKSGAKGVRTLARLHANPHKSALPHLFLTGSSPPAGRSVLGRFQPVLTAGCRPHLYTCTPVCLSDRLHMERRASICRSENRLMLDTSKTEVVVDFRRAGKMTPTSTRLVV